MLTFDMVRPPIARWGKTYLPVVQSGCVGCSFKEPARTDAVCPEHPTERQMLFCLPGYHGRAGSVMESIIWVEATERNTAAYMAERLGLRED